MLDTEYCTYIELSAFILTFIVKTQCVYFPSASLMDLAWGLCHYWTLGLPPDWAFDPLYIPIGYLESNLEVADTCEWEPFIMVDLGLSCILFV